MDRTLFSPDHELFRQAFRTFIAKEVTPHQARWREDGMVSREAWRKAGAQGFLCPWLAEAEGGPGGDFLHSVIIVEELARVHESGFALMLHSDIVVPYIHSFGTDEQRQRWLPGCIDGSLITAIAMTEPNTGSDLAAIKATAKREGDHYILNGSKTFISNGMLCDLCVVAAKTEPADEKAANDPHRNISLFVVEASAPGFIKAKKLAKMGMVSQDTTELFFEDCRVPAANRLGAEGMGFLMLMQKLQQERLCVAVGAQANAEQVLADTIAYTKERHAFGKPIAKFQNTQFKLAECATQLEVGRAFLDKVVAGHVAGQVPGQGMLDGQAVADRDGAAGDRHLPAVLRRLRLHARVPGDPRVHGCARPADLCRHQRDHEGDHRQADGAVAATRGCA